MENEKTNKPRFLKRLFKRIFTRRNLKAVARGTLKSLPYGNSVIEVIDNVKKELRKDAVAHSYISILVQLTMLTLIVWAFVTERINLHAFIDALKQMTE